MKTLLLINPAQEHSISANLPKYIDESRGHVPPLGLLYLAAMIEQKDDWNVKIADLSAGDNLTYQKPDVVGITATTFTLIDALEAAKEVKKLWNVPIVIGGIHATIFPNETSKLPNIDYVIAGEGEYLLSNNIDNIAKGYAEKVMMSTEYLDIEDLPSPARHLLDIKKYYSVLGTKSYSTTMFTSRGCPFECIFCHRKTMGRKWRALSATKIIEELKQIKALGINEILFYDDTFTISKERVIETCDRIIAENLDITFDIRARVDTVTQSMLTRLKLAGCKRIHYGVEASSNRILKRLQKGITIEQATETFRKTKNAGIETLAYFIIGSPCESVDDFLWTIEFAKELKPDYCHFAIMTPYPATPLYEKGLELDLYEDYWQKFASNPSKDFIAPFWPEHHRDILLKYLDRAYKSFYFRPSRIVKEVVKTKSLGSLQSKIQGAKKMILGRI